MKLLLQNARLAFADIFTAVKIGDDPTSKPRFGCLLIVPPGTKASHTKEDGTKVVVTLDQAVTMVATEKWKAKASGVLAVLKGKDRVCFVPGPKLNKSGEIYDGFDGMHHIRASNEARPYTLDRNKTPLTEADGRPYAGCYVNASIDMWAQDNKWGQRINSTLLGLQFVRDGDAFSAGARGDTDDMEDLGDGAQTEEESDLA